MSASELQLRSTYFSLRNAARFGSFRMILISIVEREQAEENFRKMGGELETVRIRCLHKVQGEITKVVRVLVAKGRDVRTQVLFSVYLNLCYLYVIDLPNS